MRVALFVPCYVDQLRPQIGLATLDFLTAAGFEVDFQEEVICCGQPFLTAGETKRAAALGARFVDAFQHVDAIVTPSGSCAATVAFDHDCREGICGSCGVVIDGVPHGPESGTTTCQLHMRSFKDGAEIYVEPWRAKAFPVVRDLVVDRGSFDRVVQSGAFISVNTGAPQDANAIPVPKADADKAFDAATCIGCGACVAACKNASAMLFVGAKVSHFAHLPQGRVERTTRARNLVQAMDDEGFGNCTNQNECEAVCPKEIPVRVIADMNREYLRAKVRDE